MFISTFFRPMFMGILLFFAFAVQISVKAEGVRNETPDRRILKGSDAGKCQALLGQCGEGFPPCCRGSECRPTLRDDKSGCYWGVAPFKIRGRRSVYRIHA